MNNKINKNFLYRISFLLFIIIDVLILFTHYKNLNGTFESLCFIKVIFVSLLLVGFFSTLPVFILSMIEFKQPSHEKFKIITDKIVPMMPYYVAIIFIPMSFLLK